MSIAEKANDIRNKTYGKEVREALASGIEAIDDTANTAKTIAESVTAAEIERINKEKTRIENENARVQAERNREADYTTYKNVMTAESNVAALQNNIDKITDGIGGRNLVLDSLNLKKYFATNAEFAGTVAILPDVYPISGKCTKVECTKGGTGGLFHFPFFPKTATKVGKIYTWSCYILCNKTKSVRIGHECGGFGTFNVTNGWKKISCTWKFTDSEYSSFSFYATDGWNAGDIVYIGDMKIEEGTVPSTHTNAPEDIELKQNAINLGFDLRITALETK